MDHDFSDSDAWLTALRGPEPARNKALARLHEMLRKAAFGEAHRRGPAARINGPELDDIAHQAADDAMVSILRKLDSFRGESRFTTWAYKFAVLEVANKIGRHYWRRPTVSLEAEEWEHFPERVGLDPLGEVQQQELIDTVRRAVDESLTERQRTVFVAITVNGIPADAVAAKLKTSRGAIHKTIFDARRKIRQFLTTQGCMEDGTTSGRPARQAMEVKET